MPQVINTNVPSLNAQRNLNSSQSALATSLQRLSSGLRINSAKDDAAGLSIADRMTSQIRGLNQAARNANDGVSLAQTAEGALQESGSILQRMRELAIQAANATNSASDRKSLQSEANQLMSELNRIADTTNFNGLNLLDGSFTTQNFQVGANANQTIAVSVAGASAETLGAEQVASQISAAKGGNSATLNGTKLGASAVATTDAATARASNNFSTATSATVTDASGLTAAVVIAATSTAKEAAAALNNLAGIEAAGYNAMKLDFSTILSNTALSDSINVGDKVSFSLSTDAGAGSATQNVSYTVGATDADTRTNIQNALTSAVTAINSANGNSDLTLEGVNGYATTDALTIASASGVDINLANFAVANNTVNTTLDFTAVAAGDSGARTMSLTGVANGAIAFTVDASGGTAAARKASANDALLTGLTARSADLAAAGYTFSQSAAGAAITLNRTLGTTDSAGDFKATMLGGLAGTTFAATSTSGASTNIANTVTLSGTAGQNGLGASAVATGAAAARTANDFGGTRTATITPPEGTAVTVDIAATKTAKEAAALLDAATGITATGFNEMKLDFTSILNNAGNTVTGVQTPTVLNGTSLGGVSTAQATIAAARTVNDTAGATVTFTDPLAATTPAVLAGTETAAAIATALTTTGFTASGYNAATLKFSSFIDHAANALIDAGDTVQFDLSVNTGANSSGNAKETVSYVVGASAAATRTAIADALDAKVALMNTTNGDSDLSVVGRGAFEAGTADISIASKSGRDINISNLDLKNTTAGVTIGFTGVASAAATSLTIASGDLTGVAVAVSFSVGATPTTAEANDNLYTALTTGAYGTAAGLAGYTFSRTGAGAAVTIHKTGATDPGLISLKISGGAAGDTFAAVAETGVSTTALVPAGKADGTLATGGTATNTAFTATGLITGLNGTAAVALAEGTTAISTRGQVTVTANAGYNLKFSADATKYESGAVNGTDISMAANTRNTVNVGDTVSFGLSVDGGSATTVSYAIGATDVDTRTSLLTSLGTAVAAINLANGNSDLSIKDSGNFTSLDQISVVSASGVDINLSNFALANSVTSFTLGFTAVDTADFGARTMTLSGVTGGAFAFTTTAATTNDYNDQLYAAMSAGGRAADLQAGGYVISRVGGAGSAINVTRTVLAGADGSADVTATMAGGNAATTFSTISVAANGTATSLSGAGKGNGSGVATAKADVTGITATGLVTGLNADPVAPVEGGNSAASVRGQIFVTAESGYGLKFNSNEFGGTANTNFTQVAGVGTGDGRGSASAAANTAAVTATWLVTGLNGTVVSPVETRLVTAANNSTSVRGQIIVSADNGYTLQFNANAGQFEAGALDGGILALTAATATMGIDEGNGVSAQTLAISGLSSNSVSIGANSTAKQIAGSVNAVSGSTGVSATARSEATFSGLSLNGTVSFNVYGSNNTAVAISAAVTTSDLSSLATALNQRSGTTGITAEVSSGGSLKLVNSAGYDIKIENFRHSAAVTDSAAPAQQTINVTGINGGAVTLKDGGTVAKAAQLDSTVVAGKVTFGSNSGPFSVTSDVRGASGGVLNTAAAGDSVTSAKAKLSTVDISTAAGAQNAVDIIDASLAQVNTIRADLGAVQNRFLSTVSNLTTTSENVSAARSRIQDTDFAAETASLTRNQILQQAGIAMLAQANSLPQSVLSLLK